MTLSKIAWVARPRAAMHHTGRFLGFVAARFYHDDALRVASALAYTSLLGLVPLIAIGLAIFTAFPVFGDERAALEDFIFDTFAPQLGEVLRETLSRFVENAGSLTAAGVIGIAVIAIMLLVTVEGALNYIFRVERPRGFVSRLLMYWTALTLGPLLFGASFSISGYLLAVGRWVEREGAVGTVSLVTWLAPVALVVLGLSLVYMAVPNRNVRLRDALIGGMVGGVTFTALRIGFGIYAANAQVYQSIYGAIAWLPLFLIYMYASWAVILLGAEVTAALPEWRSGRQTRGHLPPPRQRLALALDILSLHHHASLRGGRPIGRRAMLEHTAADEASLEGVLKRLIRGGFLVRTRSDQYVLARDLAETQFYELVRTLDLALGSGAPDGPDKPWRRHVQDLIDTADMREQEVFAVSIKGLIRPEAADQHADEDVAPQEDDPHAR